MTLDGLLVALGLFTRIPVRTPADRPARDVMLWAPIVGLLLGAGFVLLAGLLTALLPTPYTDVLIAVAIVGGLAYLTRGLHLDGLADTADGLGIRGDAAKARETAKRGDIGAFGVATIVIVTLAQFVLWTMATWVDALPIALLAALPTSRAAATIGCRAGSQAAPGSTLGAWVAGSVPLKSAVLVSSASLAPALLLAGWQFGVGPAAGIAAAMVAATIGGLAFHRAAAQRFEGLTGDTLGALIEITLSLGLLLLLVVLL